MARFTATYTNPNRLTFSVTDVVAGYGARALALEFREAINAAIGTNQRITAIRFTDRAEATDLFSFTGTPSTIAALAEGAAQFNIPGVTAIAGGTASTLRFDLASPTSGTFSTDNLGITTFFVSDPGQRIDLSPSRHATPEALAITITNGFNNDPRSRFTATRNGTVVVATSTTVGAQAFTNVRVELGGSLGDPLAATYQGTTTIGVEVTSQEFIRAEFLDENGEVVLSAFVPLPLRSRDNGARPLTPRGRMARSGGVVNMTKGPQRKGTKGLVPGTYGKATKAKR